MQRSLRAVGLVACLVIAACSQVVEFDRTKIPSEDAGGGGGGTLDGGKSDSGLPDAATDGSMSGGDAQVDAGTVCDPITQAGCGPDALCCDGDADGKFECIKTDARVQCERCGMPCNGNTSDDCTDRTCGCGWKSKVVCSGDASLCDPTTRECVECLVSNDCQGDVDGEFCFAPGNVPNALDNTCAECDPGTNAGCRGNKPICSPMAVCVSCAASAKTCTSPLVCLPNGACECGASADCTTPTTPICDTTSKQCEGCSGNQECVDQRALPYCVDSERCAVCVPTTEAGCSDPLKPDCRFNGSNVYECLACTTDSHCDGLGESGVCDVATGDCVECLVNGDCAGSEFCSNKVCTNKKAAGAACSVANECASNHCTDGVCCDSACGGTCNACTSAKKGSGADGACAPVQPNTDPEMECAGSLSCNGQGACQKAQGESCTQAAECGSDHCVDGFCCNENCEGACKACSAALSIGADGTCSQAETNANPGDRCAGALLCTAAGVCEKANGDACAAASECDSGNCIDQVCCNTACGGTCVACTAAKKGAGSDGSCDFIVAGDPDLECAPSQCDGAGACVP